MSLGTLQVLLRFPKPDVAKTPYCGTALGVAQLRKNPGLWLPFCPFSFSGPSPFSAELGPFDPSGQ